MELATARHLEESLVACQRSLCLLPDHANTLRLLALLHTAGGKRMEQAVKVLRLGLCDHPEDIHLYCLLARVEAVRQNPKAGLIVCRRAIEVWRDSAVTECSSVCDPLLADDSTSLLSAQQQQLIPSLAEGTVLPASPLPPSTSHLVPALAELASGGQLARIGAAITPADSSTAEVVTPQQLLQAKIYLLLGE